MPLAPLLLELEDIVERTLAQGPLEKDQVLAQFGRARAFLLESVGLFREVEDTLFVEEESAQKLELCAQEMDHSLDALDKLQEAVLGNKSFVLKERLQSFFTSRKSCLEYFAEFSRLAQQQPIYSPVPAYDAFIKAGIKVLEEQLPKSRLQERFPALIPELQKAQRLVGLLPKLHQPPGDLMTALESGLQGLETGYGAVNRYFQSDEKTALDDGLKLIGSSSTILGHQFQKAEEIASLQPKFTKYRPLEEWLRLKDFIQKNPDHGIPDEWIVATLSQVYLVWDYLLTQAQNFLNNPLLLDVEIEGGVTESLLEECLKVRSEANEQLGALNGEALLKSENEVWLSHAEHLEKLSDALEKSHRALEDHLLPFKELPGLERIVYLKQDVKRGLIDASALRHEFQIQLKKVEELIDSVRNAQDPISREFNDLLPIHRSAFIGMMENLEDDDWEGIESRWQGVLSTLPHLANLSRSIRNRLASQSSSSKLRRCLRCEAQNQPDRRVCSTCGANLPAVVQKMQTFSEINTDGEPDPGAAPLASPRAIDLLESLVQGVEQNQTSKKDAVEALQLLIDDINRQRQLFTKKLVPLMGREETLDVYLRYFAQALGAYFSALSEMQNGVGEGSLPQLQSGLTQAREALELVDLMKERIDEALRG